MATVQVADIGPKLASRSSQAGMMSEVRDVYNHNANLNSVAGDVHYHNYCAAGAGGLSGPQEQSPSSSRSELPSQLYSRMLMKKGKGYPLMDAAPPNGYHSREVMIGDVGFVAQDGTFNVLFNVCEPADGEINRGMVPEGFVRLERPPDDYRYHKRGKSCKPGVWVASTDTVLAISHPLMPGTCPGAYQFECGPGEEAVLVLPSGASKEDHHRCGIFRDYASKYGVGWYEFAKDCDITNGAMYLITGYDKARTWGTASFSTALSTPKFEMVFADSEWQEPGRSPFKEGPSSQDCSSLPENQCVFLRGYKITLSNRVLAKVFGIDIAETSPMDEIIKEADKWGFLNLLMTRHALASGLHSMLSKIGPSSVAGSPPVTATSTVSPILPAIHPSNLINLYLLSKFPDSDLAITHDSVWCSYLSFDRGHGEKVPQSLLEYIDSKYKATQENGAAYILGCCGAERIETVVKDGPGVQDLNIMGPVIKNERGHDGGLQNAKSVSDGVHSEARERAASDAIQF